MNRLVKRRALIVRAGVSSMRRSTRIWIAVALLGLSTAVSYELPRRLSRARVVDTNDGKAGTAAGGTIQEASTVSVLSVREYPDPNAPGTTTTVYVNPQVLDFGVYSTPATN